MRRGSPGVLCRGVPRLGVGDLDWDQESVVEGMVLQRDGTGAAGVSTGGVDEEEPQFVTIEFEE